MLATIHTFNYTTYSICSNDINLPNVNPDQWPMNAIFEWWKNDNFLFWSRMNILIILIYTKNIHVYKAQILWYVSHLFQWHITSCRRLSNMGTILFYNVIFCQVINWKCIDIYFVKYLKKIPLSYLRTIHHIPHFEFPNIVKVIQ